MLRTNQKRARTSKRAKIRVVKRCLTLKAGGYPGLHRFGASQLIQFVLLNKIKLADKKYYCNPGLPNVELLKGEGPPNQNREEIIEHIRHA